MVHNLLVQFLTMGSSKIEVFETCFYDIVTTQYDILCGHNIIQGM